MATINIEFAKSNQYGLAQALSNDLLIYTNQASQKYVLGDTCTITSSNVLLPSNLTTNFVTCSNLTVKNILSNLDCVSTNTTVVNTCTNADIIASNITIASTLSGATINANNFTVSNNLVCLSINSSNFTVASNISALTSSITNLTISGNLNVTGTSTGITSGASATDPFTTGLDLITTSNATLSSTISTSFINLPCVANPVDWAALMVGVQPLSGAYSAYDDSYVVGGCMFDNQVPLFYSKDYKNMDGYCISNNSVQHAFIAKYNSTGDYQWFAWIQHNSVIQNNRYFDVGTDKYGNIYAAFLGGASVATRFYNKGLSLITSNAIPYGNLPNPGGSGPVLCKYDYQGNFVWAVRFDSPGSEYFGGLSVDKNTGTCYISGNRDGNPFWSYYVSAGSNASYVQRTDVSFFATSASTFLLKVDTNGNQLFTYPPHISAWPTIYSVASDSTNNIYMNGVVHPGWLSQVPKIYDTTSTSASTYSATLTNTIFLVKYNSNGVYQWNAQVNCGNADSTNVPLGGTICVDTSDNIYTCGTIYNAATFMNANGTTTYTTPSTSTWDAYVAKYSSSGTNLWVTSIRGANNNSNFSVDYDATTNKVVVYGQAASIITVYACSNFNSGLKQIDPINTNNSYYIYLDPQSGYYYDHRLAIMTSTESRITNRGVACGNGNTYATAFYGTNVDFVHSTLGTVKSLWQQPGIQTGYGGYVVKFNNPTYPIGTMKLLANLGTDNKGFIKEIHTSSNSSIVLLVRNSNDTSTISSNVIDRSQKVRKIWTGSNWLDVVY